MIAGRIGWTRVEPDARPGLYYVSCRDERGRHGLLLGPWRQERHGIAAHARALAEVTTARRILQRENHRDAPWLQYGTCRLPLDADARPGVLEAHR